MRGQRHCSVRADKCPGIVPASSCIAWKLLLGGRHRPNISKMSCGSSLLNPAYRIGLQEDILRVTVDLPDHLAATAAAAKRRGAVPSTTAAADGNGAGSGAPGAPGPRPAAGFDTGKWECIVDGGEEMKRPDYTGLNLELKVRRVVLWWDVPLGWGALAHSTLGISDTRADRMPQSFMYGMRVCLRSCRCCRARPSRCRLQPAPRAPPALWAVFTQPPARARRRTWARGSSRRRRRREKQSAPCVRPRLLANPTSRTKPTNSTSNITTAVATATAPRTMWRVRAVLAARRRLRARAALTRPLRRRRCASTRPGRPGLSWGRRDCAPRPHHPYACGHRGSAPRMLRPLPQRRPQPHIR